MNEFLGRTYWNNSVGAWLLALGIVIIAFIIIRLFKHVVIRTLKKWSEKTETWLDDFFVAIIDSSVVPLAYIGSFALAINTLTLPPKVEKALHVAILVAITYFVLKIITAIFKQFVFSFLQKQEDSELKEKQAKGLIIIINIVIWILGIVFLIDNLGYDVTTLVAGLGIGGIAIALAAQTILGDLFSYFVIFFDRPFEIGDFLVVDDKMGTVEYIGIKTTRLRTLGGEQLVCANTDLTNARVHNYKRMQRRRVVFKLGVIYQTPVGMLKQIPALVKDIIQSKEDVTIDRGHFSGFGDFSLDFEFVYYIESSDYNTYMDQQQSIYFEIAEKFEQEKIEFAYPSQTLFISKEVEEEQAKP